MLTPRLTECKDCPDILATVDDIDCRLAELGNNLYNNVVFMLNKSIPALTIISLLHYRRILMCKYVNAQYASTYTIKMVTDRVKILKYKK